MLHMPTEVPPRTSHPPNYFELRKSLEFQYEFRTNSQGLRYREIPLKKPMNSYRVFVSGDSFTEGYGIAEGERFTDHLERLYSRSGKNVLFINGGFSGTGPLQYGRNFLDVGMRYDPDALLICIYVNDLSNTPEQVSEIVFAPATQFRSGIKELVHSMWPRIYTLLWQFKTERFENRKTDTSDFICDVSQEATKRGISKERIAQWKSSLPDTLIEAVDRGEFNGAIFSFSLGLIDPHYYVDSIDIPNERAKKKWWNMITILSDIVTQAESKGIMVAIILIPSRFQYEPGSHGTTIPWIIGGGGGAKTLAVRRYRNSN